MRLGKLDSDKLEELILSKFGHFRKEVLSGLGIGADCASVDFDGDIAVFSTDPITSADKNIGRLTVHVSCNDAAAAGAEPVAILVTLLAPPSATEGEIAGIADQLAEAAREANVEIIGGHTEVTDSVNRIITSATAIAKVEKGGYIPSGGMREGDDLVMTKYAGIEGTAVIASDFKEKLGFLSEAEMDEAASFFELISVVKEGLFAAKNGATAMHDITEGGIFGAAWEMTQSSSVGIIIDKTCIPIKPVTKKICEKLELDPYRLLSSGSMLISCRDGKKLADGLNALGVHARVIGRAGGQGVRLMTGEEIAPPQADELYKLFP